MLRLVLLLLLVSVARGGEPSFLNDVMPIFTKTGCNSGSCHGKGIGQNGFHLSLRGYAPEQDWKAIVREFAGRRVALSEPDASLLLAKATGRAAHGGGQVLDPASADYATVRGWIAAGAPKPNPADRKLEKLTLTAGSSLKPTESRQLTATAHWSDGSTSDVTRHAVWESNDANVLTTATTGLVTARSRGATAVRAAYLSEVAATAFVVPFEAIVDDAKFLRTNFIDDHVNERLKQLRIEPSPRSDDATFLRRAMLDALGVLPTSTEARAFLADPRPDKRAKLVDAILQRPEFADFWSLFLSDLLQNRRERDHDIRGAAGVQQFHGWLHEQLAARRGWDVISRDVLLARGSVDEHPAVGFYIVTVGEHKETEKSEVAESVAQIFLGTRIGCARCHNHPLEKSTQDDFYHFAAGFTRVSFKRGDPKKNQPATLNVGFSDVKENAKPVEVHQPRTGKMLKPQTLDRQPLKLVGDDPRTALVDWMLAQPSFRTAMANRLWKHFLGTGLVEPVDDLRPTNPPSNPALLDALAGEFAGKGYQFSELIRAILNSEAYQRTSNTTPQNASDSRFYSHFAPRRLPSEVLLDAVSIATGVPEKFAGYPLGWRAVQIADPAAASPFLKMFGSSDRTTACACERLGDVTLPQALSLLNGERIPIRLLSPEGTLAKLLTQSDDRVIDELFLSTFTRRPTPTEREAVASLLKTEPRAEVFRDLAWALLNSKEFVFNH